MTIHCLDGYGLPGRIARHTSPAARRALVSVCTAGRWGNSALGTRTLRLTLKPTVGTCEGRMSGFTAADGDDGDAGGALRCGTPGRGARGGPRPLRAEIGQLAGFKIPAGGRPETDAARPDPTRRTRPTPGLRDGPSRAAVHVRQPPARDPRDATEALDSSVRAGRNVRGGFGFGGLLG